MTEAIPHLKPPVLTLTGALLVLAFVLPFAAMGNGLIDPRGQGGHLIWIACYSVPVVGFILLMGGAARGERMNPLRILFGLLYLLWMIGLAIMFALGAMFGMGNSW